MGPKRAALQETNVRQVKKVKNSTKPIRVPTGWVWTSDSDDAQVGVKDGDRTYYHHATFFSPSELPMRIAVEDLVTTRVEESDEETRALKLKFWIGQVASMFETADGEKMFMLRFFDQPNQWKYMNGEDGRMLQIWAKSFRKNEIIETDVCEENPLEIILSKIQWETAPSNDLMFSDRMIIRCGSDGKRRGDLSDSLWPAPAHRRRHRLLTQCPSARFSLQAGAVNEPTKVLINDDAYTRAVDALKLSVLPVNLPCREAETDAIRTFIKLAVKSTGQSGNVLYISGVPGAGKTASVLSVVKSMQGLFNFAHINSMKLNTPTDLYSDLLYELSLKKTKFRADKPQDKLTEYFSSPKLKNKVTVLLVDEIDYLVTKSQAVVYQLFDWPLLANSKLVLITISNTMDLPERLMPRVASRLGLSRLSYLPYQHEQIRKVIEERLKAANAANVFSTEAIAFCSRKVASSNGDIRKALHLCRRAIEMRSSAIVGVTDINIAHSDLYTSSSQAVIAHLCYFGRLVLLALVLICKMNNSDGALLREVFDRFEGIARTCQPQFKFRPTNYSDFMRVLTQLEECGIVKLAKYHHSDGTASNPESMMAVNADELQACNTEAAKPVRNSRKTKAVIGKDNGAENDQDGSTFMVSLSQSLEHNDIRHALIDEAGDRVAQRFWNS